jgi:hypothetical protein
MYIAHKIGNPTGFAPQLGTIVSGGSFVLSQPAGARVAPVGGMDYSLFGLQRYSDISGQSMVPFFFNHDRDLMPVFAKIARDQNLLPRDAETDYLAKCAIYRAAGLDVIAQERKMHGFEKIKDHCDDLPVPDRLRLKYLMLPSTRPYDMLYRYNLEEHGVQYSTSSTTIFDLDRLTTSQ